MTAVAPEPEAHDIERGPDSAPPVEVDRSRLTPEIEKICSSRTSVSGHPAEVSVMWMTRASFSSSQLRS